MSQTSTRPTVRSNEETVVNFEKIKALTNKDRIRILDILIKSGPLSWSELQENLKVNPNTLNFHLTKLLHNELIRRQIVENRNKRPSSQYQILPEGKRQLEKMRQH